MTSATMIDLPRIVVLVEQIIVICMYVWLAGHCWKMSIGAKKEQATYFLYRGRALFAIGIVLLTLATIHVTANFYGEDLSPRVPIIGLAMIFLSAAWMMSFRFDVQEKVD
jgi:hypothetical protein